MADGPIVEEEVAVPAVTAAAQMAMRARQQLVTAAAAARPDRRPAASTQEIAVPLVNAVDYLASAVLDLQGQVARLEALVERTADAAIATAAVADDAGRLKA